jgi:predicted AlkP superfamily pyrophosphatase or phosphodiesterase
MRNRLALVVILLSIAVHVGPRAQTPPQPAARATAPKLVVILVVDQLWAGYLDQLKPRWTSGFKRLTEHGAWFRNAAYPYLNTVTCVGHSTISTGALPYTHGMILNGWWDRDAQKIVTCTGDPASPLVPYGAAAAGGESPSRILVPTFSDELRTHDGAAARIVTMSIKPRSAIALAGHSANAATWFGDNDVWTTSTAYPGAPVPFVKEFLQANPVEKDFGATWTRLLPDDTYAYKDDAEGEKPAPNWTRTFPHVLKGASDKPDLIFYAQWEESPFSDEYLGKFAAASVDALHLGHGDATDYLGVSFSATDAVGHGFGPRSHESQDVLLRLDRTLGVLLDHLDKAVGADQYVVALSSDHGVAPIPEQLVSEGRDAGRIDTNVIAARVNQTLQAALGPKKYLSAVVYTDLYFAPGIYADLLSKPQTLKAVIDTIREVPGVARVLRGDQLPALRTSKDPIERAAALSYYPARSGDLIVVPKPNWILSMAAGTTHGSANEYDQRVPIILLGANVKPGAYTEAATPADVAPTLAALCGFTLPKADGRILREAVTLPNGTRSEQARGGR